MTRSCTRLLTLAFLGSGLAPLVASVASVCLVQGLGWEAFKRERNTGLAAALRAGAERVDAIEIDPAILVTGVAAHPERPYDDRRVRLIVDDARSFIRRTG